MALILGVQRPHLVQGVEYRLGLRGAKGDYADRARLIAAKVFDDPLGDASGLHAIRP